MRSATVFVVGFAACIAAGQSGIPRDVDGWSKAKWGMTEEQIVQAFDGEARRLPTPLRSQERYVPIDIPSLRIGDSQFTATFIMDSTTNSLFSIGILPLGGQSEAARATDSRPFNDLKTMLTQQYGQPTTAEELSESSLFKWEFRSTRIELKWHNVSRLGIGDGTVLYYSQILAVAAAEASGTKTSMAITGKAFAVTTGGDLKVARFAQVIVITGVAAAQFRRDHPLFDSSESGINQLRSLGRRSKTLEAQLRLTCLEQLHKSLTGALELKTRYPGLVSASEADEEGTFKVAGLIPEPHTVLVFGRAGANAGLWMDDVNVEAAKEPLKMRSPKVVCFDPDGLWKL